MWAIHRLNYSQSLVTISSPKLQILHFVCKRDGIRHRATDRQMIWLLDAAGGPFRVWTLRLNLSLVVTRKMTIIYWCIVVAKNQQRLPYHREFPTVKSGSGVKIQIYNYENTKNICNIHVSFGQNEKQFWTINWCCLSYVNILVNLLVKVWEFALQYGHTIFSFFFCSR